MTQPQKNFIRRLNALKIVRLSTAKKGALRSNLMEYADMHKVMRAEQASVAKQTRAATPSPFISFIYSRTFISAALIIVLIVGSGAGVSYAAGNSLPGQPFYDVKVDVEEPIEGALITSPTGKADWQNELAERRLTEATTLAADNDLSSSTQMYLEQQATLHIHASEQDSAQIAAEGQKDNALAIRSDLEARLSAHARLLALLDAHLEASGDATTSNEVALLLQDVSQNQTMVSLSREASEASLSGNASSTTGVFAPATTTPAERAGMAFIQTQDTDRRNEENQLFTQNAIRLGLLGTGTASTSTTPHRHHGDESTTMTTNADASTTTDTDTSDTEASSSTNINTTTSASSGVNISL